MALAVSRNGLYASQVPSQKTPGSASETRLQEALADHYRVDREIGRGGMATVYLAHDLKHRRPVAIKILHPHLAANVGPERFEREVEIAARLSHPHILPLFDSGEAGGFLYFVMPFVAGESLRDRLTREGKLGVAEALRIARDVAGAMGYAHAQGVVHRDIKPENVMLHEGEAMVTDFGIAKALSASEVGNLTQTGTSVGTPAYMSPEQASGDQELDGRSDIYSLGCMLYEMLAGEPPFTGPTAQAIVVRRFTEAAPSVRAKCAGVPIGVDHLISQMLARAPSARVSSAMLLAQSLTSLIPGNTPGDLATVVTSQQVTPKSIAVLPFVDMSPQKDQDYFCEGIAEEIINALTKIDALRVASRSSAFAFKGRNEDIRRVGEQLSVATVLEGSVRKAGERIRITAQLINVSDGYHLWSERYDRQLEDVFAVQDEISDNIVRALRIVLSEDEKRALEKPRADNVEAYEYYLRGRQFFHQFREKGLQFARRMFARAIEIDPSYARAHSGIADCSSMLYHYWDASEANLNQAESASRRALELAPDLAEAHAARGLALSLSKRYPEAEAELSAAIRLDPKLFEGHYYFGLALFQEGKFEEAAISFDRASTVRPEDYQASALGALCLVSLGREVEAVAGFRKTAMITERHVELNPEDARAWYMGACNLSRLGQREKALEWGDRAMALDPDDSGVLYNLACLNATENQVDRSLELLERAVENGFGHREWIENDPDLNSLRDQPRYKALLARL
jgi:serine/threonine protein kinase/tetratricopeptide (TPR) repeat protein